ncbi:MAG TPA: glycosyltransferase family 39 protein [Anaerolineaceae bacterium]|nr:glycosyltransferase family 39 protein [Anaerolineaceae bacterium]
MAASLASLFYYFWKESKTKASRLQDSALVSAVLALLSAGNMVYHTKLRRQARQRPKPSEVEDCLESVTLIQGPAISFAPEPFQALSASQPVIATPETGRIRPPDPVQPFLEISWPNGNPFARWAQAIDSRFITEIKPGQITQVVFFIGGPVLAILLAYIAQGIYDVHMTNGITLSWPWLEPLSETTRLVIGTGIYLVSALIWIFLAPSKGMVSAEAKLPSEGETEKDRHRPARFLIFLGSLTIYVVTIFIYVVIGENDLVRGLWLAGLILFIFSQIRWPRTLRSVHPEAEQSPRFHWLNWAVILIILVVAFFLRFYQLATIPNDFHGDYASHGIEARTFLSGEDRSIFGEGWNFPRMAFIAAAASMSVFGNNLFGMQMASVIEGLLCLLATYLLVWRLFNSHRLAALTMAVLAINTVHIHFSRIAENMDPWPYALFAFFFLVDGLKSRRASSFGFAGILCALSMQMYTGGRVSLFIIGCFLVCIFIFKRQWILQNKAGLLLFGVGWLLATGPSLVYNLTHWDIYAGRAREVYLFEPGVLRHLMGKYQVSSVLGVVLTQIKLSLLMFNHSIDSSTQFGFPHPMFSSLVSPLAVLGLGFSLRRWKEPGMMFLISWLGLICVVGSILTVDAPAWPRLVGILPAGALLIALALDQTIELGKRIPVPGATFALGGLVFLLLASTGSFNWEQYYSHVYANAHPEAMIGRFLSQLPGEVSACGITTRAPISVREVEFLAWPRQIVAIDPGAPDEDVLMCPNPPFVWIISPDVDNKLGVIRAIWPVGTLQDHFATNGDLIFRSYMVGYEPKSPPNQAAPARLAQGRIILTTAAVIGSVLLAWWWAFGRKKKRAVAGVTGFTQGAVLRYLPVVQVHWSAFQQLKPNLDAGEVRARVIAAVRETWDEFNLWYNQLFSLQIQKIGTRTIIRFISAILIPAFAIGLAYFAQSVFDLQKDDGLRLLQSLWPHLSEDLSLDIGCAIYLLAALIWALSAGRLPAAKEIAQAGSRTGRVASGIQRDNILVPRSTVWQLARISGLFSATLAIMLYLLNGENSLVRWLYGLGLGLFLLSLWQEKRFRAQMAANSEESPAFRWHNILIVCLLLAFAFFLRIYRLTDIPYEMSTDTAAFGNAVREYITGTEQRIFGAGWFYTIRMGFLPYVASMSTFGNNIFGLYLATVVMGTLNILGIYLFVWRLFDSHRLALLTSILVAIHPGHIEYSRIVSYIDPWFVGFFALYFLVDGLKGRRKISLALAGVFTGFVLQTYPSGRAVLIIMAIILAWAWLVRRSWITENRENFSLLLAGFLVALGPALVYMITNWNIYIKRTQEVFLFEPEIITHLEVTYHVQGVNSVIAEQIKRTFLMFNYYVDRSAHFGYPHPMFNSIISPFLVLGLGTCLIRCRKPEYAITALSFAAILITGGVLTVNAPTWTRLVGIIPFAALIIALALDQLWGLLERIDLSVFSPFLAIGVAGLLIGLAFADWNSYMKSVDGLARPVVMVGRYLDTLPRNTTACGLTDGYDLSWEETQFFGWPRTIKAVQVDTPVLTPDICAGQPIVWILSPNQRSRLQDIETIWPGGSVAEHSALNGDTIFTSYFVSGTESGSRFTR